MTVQEILAKLGRDEENLPIGTKIYQSKCEVCKDSFGYILVEPDKRALRKNIVVFDGYEQPGYVYLIKCLCCGVYFRHAQDLFPILIYEKKGE
jgi:hypothetical protein